MSKRRSDHGTFRASERDLYLLRWVGDQFAVNTDQLKILMNRWKRIHEPDWRGESLSDETVKYLIKRWRRAGWVKSRTILARKPAWVWLSDDGITEMGLKYPTYEPAVGSLTHICLVNMVRLYLEERLGGEVQWISERQINPERKKQKKRHVVDSEAIYQDTVVAIEVEQTAKNKHRMASIVRELQQDYEAVWYFVSDKAMTVVRDEIAKLEGTDDQDEWETFVLYLLSDAASQTDC